MTRKSQLQVKGKLVNHRPVPQWHIYVMINLGLLILYAIGKLRDFLHSIGIYAGKIIVDSKQGYPPLYKGFEDFYVRNFFRRLRDGWDQPIKSVPGEEIDLWDRRTDDYNFTYKYPGTCTRAINMGSYNYLGMAENKGPRIEAVCNDIKQYGSGTTSCRSEFGTTATLNELETKMAQYLGVEAAFVVGMGFATNSNNIPVLVGGPSTLIMSDELNHASVIVGCKISGATSRVFKHNDTVDLERKLRRELLRGQPTKDGSFKPWRKVIIVCEGIYSMEGTIVDLPEIIRIKKKYKAYLYLDEAHSIGALDKSAVFYHGCDPKDVDILMGTFTKSFGAAGGYICGSQKLINYLKIKSHASCYTAALAAPIARQIIGVIDSINGNIADPVQNDGLVRIKKLRENTLYFREKLKSKGFMVIGDRDSPVVPLIVYTATIVVEIIRAARERGVAFVGAGFPATGLLEARVRFCVSAAHTREMLDHVVDVMDDLGDKMHIKFAQD